MTGLSDNACPSCGGRNLEVKDWRLRCVDCDWTPLAFGVDGLAGLLTAYRLATAAQDGVWSPIEQERLDYQAAVLAREIADLLAAQPDREPVLV